MFNFTTQSVYNNIVVSSDKEGGSIVSGANVIVNSKDKKTPYIRIGNTRFNIPKGNEKLAYGLTLQVKKPTPESFASVTFDMSKIKIDDADTTKELTGRIVLYITLSMNSQDSFYANDLVYKGKPIFIEFPVKKGDSAATIAARVAKNANKYFALTVGSEKIVNVTNSGDNVTITGVNGYQQFTKAILQKFDPEVITVDCCTSKSDYVDIVTGVPVIYTVAANGTVTTENKKLVYQNATGKNVVEALDSETEVAIKPGLEAFGDYNWIIHNLRLPTLANTYTFSPTHEELPAVGQVYSQFIITMCKERDGISGEIVGARAKSVTTHVFYVAGDYTVAGTPAKVLYDELDDLGIINTDADTKLAAPYGTTTEENSSDDNSSDDNSNNPEP